LTDVTIQHYLNGRSIIVEWQKLAAEEYERFTTIQSLYEDKVQEMCMFPSADHNQLLDNINYGVEEKVKSSFGHLDEITIDRLKNYVIADWILRCPIDFE